MGNDPVNRIDSDGGRSVRLPGPEPTEPEYDGRESDEMIARNNAIGEGGSYGSRENKFYFENGMPVNNGHQGSETYANYELKVAKNEAARIALSRMQYKSNHSNSSSLNLKGIINNLIRDVVNLFDKYDRSVEDNRTSTAKLYKNEGKAYSDMLSRMGIENVEQVAFITDAGVLVLPSINNEIRVSDFKILPTRLEKGVWQVKYKEDWLNILATVHTHPNGELPYGSDYNNVKLGMGPSFILTNSRVYVAYMNNKIEYYSNLFPVINVTRYNWSLRDNIKNIPKK